LAQVVFTLKSIQADDLGDAVHASPQFLAPDVVQFVLLLDCAELANQRVVA
jgi:hypothetical protein